MYFDRNVNKNSSFYYLIHKTIPPKKYVFPADSV